MNTLDQFSQSWLAWITSATWQLALLVCIVASIGWLVRSASPRLRYGLWLLVLVKVFLPPTLTTPLSIGNWAIGPIAESAKQYTEAVGSRGRSSPNQPIVTSHGVAGVAPHSPTNPERSVAPLSTVLFVIWASGCVLFWGIVGWRYMRLLRLTRDAPSIDEGPARIALERIALQLNIRRVPELITTTTVTSPFLFGVVHPRIVLPDGLTQKLSEDDSASVLTHELVHWKRRDTWIGWLQVLAQSLFWFHPFVWLANGQLRHERECACDETVLRLGEITPATYGESIVRVLTTAKARSLVGGSLVGVFERGAKLQNRLEDIMNYAKDRRRFGWISRAGILVAALLLLPMAPRVAQWTEVADAEEPQRRTAQENKTDRAPKTPYPVIVATIPEQGATGVSYGLKEITVEFDRDMGGGMSWTGGGPAFPTVDKRRQARWTNPRTCVLPVKLEKGKFYRVGINSTSFQNFRSQDGTPTPSSAIFFTTVGASPSIERRVRLPKIVEIEPENGATDVDPGTKALRVTFNTPMGEGMSWTGGGENFPDIPDDKRPRWSRDGRTCTLSVSLKPDHEYRLGLNSLSHINFQSKWGVPLEPVVYKFRTSKGADEVTTN